MFKICEKSCVSVHDLSVSKRIVIYNKSIISNRNSHKIQYGPIQYHLPMDEKRYYNVETGELLRKSGALERSLRRARTAIIDLAKINAFTHFGTITIADDKFDVKNIKACLFAMMNCLKSYRQLCPDFRYIVVPEFGEKTKRLHFHFLMKGLRDKDLFINENGYLDMHYFRDRFGWVQITRIGSSRADIEYTAIYCGKYITKDNIQINSHRYLRSKDLLRVVKRTYENPMLAFKIRQLLERYFGEVCYYEKECICYDIPKPLYDELRQSVMDSYLMSCYIDNHKLPSRWNEYELPS